MTHSGEMVGVSWFESAQLFGKRLVKKINAPWPLLAPRQLGRLLQARLNNVFRQRKTANTNCFFDMLYDQHT